MDTQAVRDYLLGLQANIVATMERVDGTPFRTDACTRPDGERLQDDATPEVLAKDTLAWLDDPARCDRLQQKFTDLHQSLRQNTAQKASDAIANLLEDA